MMLPQTGSIRDLLQTRRDEVRRAHQAGADGWSTCRALSAATDEVLRLAFETGVEPSVRARCAVMAIGGYGRNELCPRSDIDIMVLMDDGPDVERVRDAVRQFLHLLWDAGLDVGHSVRTQDEALALQIGRAHV